MSELKKEFKNFMEDMEKNIKDKEDLEYIKNRTADFMNIVLEQMENILNYKEDKISQIEKIQNDIEEKISAMQQDISDIEQEIYIDDDSVYDDMEDIEEINEPSDYDFEIVCPYCDNEFLIDLNLDENNEVQCPRCNNIIELEWSGNSEEDEHNHNSNCKGHCQGCTGCEDDDM